MITFVKKKQIPKDFTGVCRVFERSETRYYLNGKAHREDLPAVINDDGMLQYWLNGQLHRLDGPAISCRKKSNLRWDDEYRIHGRRYNKEEYNKHILVKTYKIFSKIKKIINFIIPKEKSI